MKQLSWICLSIIASYQYFTPKGTTVIIYKDVINCLAQRERDEAKLFITDPIKINSSFLNLCPPTDSARRCIQSRQSLSAFSQARCIGWREKWDPLPETTAWYSVHPPSFHKKVSVNLLTVDCFSYSSFINSFTGRIQTFRDLFHKAAD